MALPHFPVIRPDRATTKVRIVFDASAIYQGRSLNTETLTGPKLQSNIFDILVRFRKKLVALAGDVSQMYHQLALQPDDRPFHRFLWLDLDSSRRPETYEFQRFIFGGRYCPYCAQYVWQQHARDHKDQYPSAAEAVLKNCYMDDLMSYVKSIEEARTMRKQITELGDKAGFHVRKWISHRPEVVQDIPDQDRATEIDLGKTVLPTTKTLGVLWNAHDMTRRQVLVPVFSPTRRVRMYEKKRVKENSHDLRSPRISFTFHRQRKVVDAGSVDRSCDMG